MTTYTATITNLTTGKVEHVTGESKGSIDAVARWASVQGIAGYDVLNRIGAACFALENCHTGERAKLVISSSKIV